MVKRCAWGICNSDTRYPERLEGGVTFVPFPKPTRQLEKCMRWIKLCNRSHEQLNVEKVRNNYQLTKCMFAARMEPSEVKIEIDVAEDPPLFWLKREEDVEVADQVLRKKKSLRGSFNNTKRQKTNDSSGDPEKEWCHFERISSFLDNIASISSGSQSNLNQKSPEEDSTIKDLVTLHSQAVTLPIVITSEQTSGGRSTTLTRPALHQPVTMPACAASNERTTATKGRLATLHASLEQQIDSNSKLKRCLSQPPGPSQPDQLTSAVLKMTSAIEEKNARKKQLGTSPNAEYGQYVVDRLDKIKSAKTLLIVQNKIDNLFYETLINEMYDDAV